MDYCPYCVRAKQLLDRRGYNYEEIKIDPNNPQIWAKMEERSGMKTLPQIFFDQKCIGGYSDLEAIDKRGELTKLLESE